MELKGGGPAFPHREYESRPFYHGMSLRDWFAGMAMQGMLSASSMLVGQSTAAVEKYFNAIELSAYKVADNMLAEREK